MASRPELTVEGSDEIFQKCDVCLTNQLISKAISFCIVCKEDLCKMCDQAHRGSRATRDHKIISGTRKSSHSAGTKPYSPIWYCEQHTTSPISVYCYRHGAVTCGACLLTDHSNCYTVNVSQLPKDRKNVEEFEEAMARLDFLQKKYKALNESRKRDKLRMERMIKTCQQNVKEMKQQINEMLDALEKQLIKEAYDLKTELGKELEKHVTITEDALIEINAHKKALQECQRSKDNDAMFVGVKKSDAVERKYEEAISEIKQRIYPIIISFEENEVACDVLQQLESLGSIVKKKDLYDDSNVMLNMNVSESQSHSISSRDVWDIAFLKNKYLVISCCNGGLALLDKHFKALSKLPLNSFRLAKVNEEEVIVTQCDERQLQRMRFFPEIDVTEIVKMDRKCYGVDVFGNEIYVTCHDGPGNGEVRVLNIDGSLQRQLGVNAGEYMFRGPDSVKVGRCGSIIFVSDFDTSEVTCLATQGDVLYKYSDKELRWPRGLYVDDEGTVLVCGGDSHNVHMIRQNGLKEKIVLSKKNGLKDPRGILYIPSRSLLVIGLSKAEKPLLVFKTS